MIAAIHRLFVDELRQGFLQITFLIHFSCLRQVMASVVFLNRDGVIEVLVLLQVILFESLLRQTIQVELFINEALGGGIIFW